MGDLLLPTRWPPPRVPPLAARVLATVSTHPHFNTVATFSTHHPSKDLIKVEKDGQTELNTQEDPQTTSTLSHGCRTTKETATCTPRQLHTRCNVAEKWHIESTMRGRFRKTAVMHIRSAVLQANEAPQKTAPCVNVC